MSISSSMNAGVAGLQAQASQLAAVSDNIANSSTAGYKRATTDFAAMVLDSGAGTYTAGGVRTTSVRLVEDRGSLTTTSNSTDLAIGGRGFLPVTTAAGVATGGDLPFLMTTTGSFRPDAEGYLTTPSGLVLMGVPVEDGVAPNFGRTSADALVPVRIDSSEIVGSPTSNVGLSGNLPATSTVAGSAGTPEVMSIVYYDNLGGSQTLTATFTPTVPAAGDPPSNEWTMTLTDGASGGAVVGEYVITFDDGPGTGGDILTVATTSGGAYDAATGSVSVTTASGPIEITIGGGTAPGAASGGFTQLAAKFTPGTTTRDGAAAQKLVGVEVDPAGYVVGSYGSGETRRLYQIPVVDVPNPNGLTALSNQTYAPSQASGSFILWDAGDGPTGAIQGYAREESAVDVAQELTQLIKTQRAYSSNAKVIQTVDEMLQETTNIKR
jgi:flagellar hook protein FlgE